jgi:hypothetical protein
MIFDKNEFVTWLNGKHLFEIVGTCGDPEACPLANYLTEKGIFNDHADSFVEVDEDEIIYIENEINFTCTFPSPAWVTEFVKDIDSKCGYNKDATVEDCLEVLYAADPEV